VASSVPLTRLSKIASGLLPAELFLSFAEIHLL